MASTELQLWSDESTVVATVGEAARVELELAELQDRAKGYAKRSKADNTWKAYLSDLRHFDNWCELRDLSTLPAEPETVQLYLVDFADRLAVSTLRRRLSAIAVRHKLAELPNPTTSALVTVTWDGIRKEHGTEPRSKQAAVTDVVSALVGPMGESLRDVRDRALILIGFAGAMRRSELAALDVAGITETADGLRIHLDRSKTDQEAKGATIGIAYGSNRLTCPVRSWRAWLEASGMELGPAFPRLFRYSTVSAKRLTGDSVGRIVQRRAELAGLDPKLFGGHSLRRGFATEAARKGVHEHKIMSQGRWLSTKSMHGYIQEGELFVNNPSAELGL